MDLTKLAEVRKAVAAAVVSVAALAGFFVTVDPNVVQSALAVVAALTNVYVVWRTTNAPSTTAP